MKNNNIYINEEKKRYIKKPFASSKTIKSPMLFSNDMCIKWKENKLVNPITKRKIILNGPVYKKFEKNCKINNNIITDKKINIPDYLGCSVVGMKQKSYTCWFNAPFNGLVLASDTSNMLLQDIKKLNLSEIKKIHDFKQINSCPVNITKKYVYSYLLKIHDNKYQQNTTKNESANFVNKTFTPGKLPSPVARGETAYFPLKGIKQLLTRCFGKDSYEVLKFPTQARYLTKKFVIVSVEEPVMPSDFIEQFLSEIGRWNLSHLVYIIKNNYGGSHAAVSYICNGKKYIYDSNNDFAQMINWGKLWSEDNVIKYSPEYNSFFSVIYGLYVRE